MTDIDTQQIKTMDKDIREFLDRATQKRLYEEKRKRKYKRLAKQANLLERRSHRNAAQNGLDILYGEHIKGDDKLRRLADSGRDYSTGTKFRTKYRTPEGQKKYDWKNRPRFISVPMGGQNKKY